LITKSRADVDEERDRLDRRSSLLKNLIWIPITGGISLIRYFLHPKER